MLRCSNALRGFWLLLQDVLISVSAFGSKMKYFSAIRDSKRGETLAWGHFFFLSSPQIIVKILCGARLYVCFFYLTGFDVSLSSAESPRMRGCLSRVAGARRALELLCVEVNYKIKGMSLPAGARRALELRVEVNYKLKGWTSHCRKIFYHFIISLNHTRY